MDDSKYADTATALLLDGKFHDMLTEEHWESDLAWALFAVSGDFFWTAGVMASLSKRLDSTPNLYPEVRLLSDETAALKAKHGPFYWNSHAAADALISKARNSGKPSSGTA